MLYKLLGALTGQLRVKLKHLNPVNEGLTPESFL